MPNLTGGKGGDALGGNMQTSAMFNASGWTVNTGAGTASGAPAGVNIYLIGGLVIAGLLAWKMYLKK
ncbi:MAG: hypothetical protein Q7U78_05930 [Gallionella sp.]|nr:hypothetical protein [Gallionella sp.]